MVAIQKKKKKKTIILIISGLILIAIVSAVAYFAWPKKEVKVETNQQTNEKKIQQLQSKLSQIKNDLEKPENSSQKTKFSTKITEIEDEVKNLHKKNNQEQEGTIQRLEEEVKEINQKLENDTPDNDDPPPNDDPDPNQNEVINYVTTKINDNIFKYHFSTVGVGENKLTWKSVMGLLKLKSKVFFQAFQGALKDANLKFPAYFWKCPPVSKNTLNKPFEFVVIKEKGLDTMTENYSDFEDYLAQLNGKNKPSVISFPNNRNPSDTILVIPAYMLGGKHVDCKNITQFTKNAPDEQQQELWQEVAKKLSEELEKSDAPRWLNTHGLGVHYLHVRIDETARYYSNYLEYKKWE